MVERAFSFLTLRIREEPPFSTAPNSTGQSHAELVSCGRSAEAREPAVEHARANSAIQCQLDGWETEGNTLDGSHTVGKLETLCASSIASMST